MTTPTNIRSIVFLSCDITGSTAFKQRPGAAWQRTFLSFYREFPQRLGELVGEHAPDLRFTLWKAIGDELIFTCPVESEREVFDAVRVWLRVMDAYEVGSLRDHGLGTKGGAFIATFPGPDSECAIPRDPSTEQSDKGIITLNREAITEDDLRRYQYDYFGPSIDTGFRVVNAATARHFTLSVEVAWAMQRCHHDAADDDGRTHHRELGDLVLMHAVDLKGVWGGRPYPLFALDRQQGDAVNRALKALDGAACDPKLVGRVCAACVESDGWPAALHLPGSTFPPFTRVPADPLAEMSDNEMDGAESVQVGVASSGAADLEAAPPLE